jgi:hypothetical protein
VVGVETVGVETGDCIGDELLFVVAVVSALFASIRAGGGVGEADSSAVVGDCRISDGRIGVGMLALLAVVVITLVTSLVAGRVFSLILLGWSAIRGRLV